MEKEIPHEDFNDLKLMVMNDKGIALVYSAYSVFFVKLIKKQYLCNQI